MERAQASRTIWRPALLRAAHQILDEEPKILVDRISVGLVPESTEHAIRAQADTLREPPVQLVRSAFLLRARFAEDELADAVRRGARQYVILGAGLDTFALRQPAFAHDLTIFEVDAAATQSVKLGLIRHAGLRLPTNLTLVALDLEDDVLAEQLQAQGFDPAVPAFFSLLGVAQYLTRSAVEATLRFVVSGPPGSGIVFSFNPPDAELDGENLAEVEGAAARGASFGEPWLTRLRDSTVSRLLREMGFRTVLHLTPEIAQDRYFANRRDGLRAPTFEQMIVARV